MGSLAAAIPEMSKMPESPPGYYGFDPLNLKEIVCVCVTSCCKGHTQFKILKAGGRWGFVQSATNEDAARFP